MLTAMLIATAAFAAAPVSDDELSDMRGGFALPGGLEASIAVQTETSVDGGLLLRSVYRLDQGAPSLQVFSPRAGESVRGQSAGIVARDPAMQGAVRVNFDRQNGFSISRDMGMPVETVTVRAGAQPSEAQADTLQPLDLTVGSVETPGGRVSITQADNGIRSRIEGDGIDATHLFGNAFGTVVANTGNDRAIDNATMVSLDLRGATPLNLGSALLRAEAIADQAVSQMVVR